MYREFEVEEMLSGFLGIWTKLSSRPDCVIGQFKLHVLDN